MAAEGRSAGAGRSGVAVAALLLLAAAGCAPRRNAEPKAESERAPREPVEARASVEPAVATTGDRIRYRVVVDYDEGYEVEVPEPGAEIAGFRILELGREEPRHAGGRVTEERWYELRADLVGSYVLPPVTVSYRPRGTGEEVASETVETSALFVEVESVLPSDGSAADIRDLKPLRRAASPLPWGAIGGAAAALLAALAGWWWWWRRRRAAVAPPVPAHETAFAALAALRETDFDDPAAVRRFYFGLSETVRGYVEGRFALNATDLTTEEILARLRGVEALEAEQRRRLGGLLADTDLVKFAEHEPRRDEIESAYERALAFVEATRPVAAAQLDEREAAA